MLICPGEFPIGSRPPPARLPARSDDCRHLRHARSAAGPIEPSRTGAARVRGAQPASTVTGRRRRPATHSLPATTPRRQRRQGRRSNGGATPNERSLLSYFFQPRPTITGSPAAAAHAASVAWAFVSNRAAAAATRLPDYNHCQQLLERMPNRDRPWHTGHRPAPAAGTTTLFRRPSASLTNRSRHPVDDPTTAGTRQGRIERHAVATTVDQPQLTRVPVRIHHHEPAPRGPPLQRRSRP